MISQYHLQHENLVMHWYTGLKCCSTSNGNQRDFVLIEFLIVLFCLFFLSIEAILHNTTAVYIVTLEWHTQVHFVIEIVFIYKNILCVIQ